MPGTDRTPVLATAPHGLWEDDGTHGGSAGPGGDIGVVRLSGTELTPTELNQIKPYDRWVPSTQRETSPADEHVLGGCALNGWRDPHCLRHCLPHTPAALHWTSPASDLGGVGDSGPPQIAAAAAWVESDRRPPLSLRLTPNQLHDRNLLYLSQPTTWSLYPNLKTN